MKPDDKLPTIISDEIFLALVEKTLPKPAPILYRGLAFLADGILIFFAMIPAWRFLLPALEANGHYAFNRYWEQLTSAYEAALKTVGTPNFDAVSALVTQMSQDEALVSFVETAYIVSFIISVLYFVLIEHFWSGQTLGKKIFGLRTVSFGTHRPPAFLQSISRAFWKAIALIPAGAILLVISTINTATVAFARRHRGWHDKLSRTEVVDTRQQESKPKV